MRFRLTFTVDLTGDSEVPDEQAAIEKAGDLAIAFQTAMDELTWPGALLPAVMVAEHPFPRPADERARQAIA